MKVKERTKNSGVTPTEATRALAGAGAGNRHTHTEKNKNKKQTPIATSLSPPKPIRESRTRFILSPETNDDKKKEDNAGERERRRKKREGSLNKHEHSGRRSRYTPVLFFL